MLYYFPFLSQKNQSEKKVTRHKLLNSKKVINYNILQWRKEDLTNQNQLIRVK